MQASCSRAQATHSGRPCGLGVERPDHERLGGRGVHGAGQEVGLEAEEQFGGVLPERGPGHGLVVVGEAEEANVAARGHERVVGARRPLPQGGPERQERGGADGGDLDAGLGERLDGLADAARDGGDAQDAAVDLREEVRRERLGVHGELFLEAVEERGTAAPAREVGRVHVGGEHEVGGQSEADAAPAVAPGAELGGDGLCGHPHPSPLSPGERGG